MKIILINLLKEWDQYNVCWTLRNGQKKQFIDGKYHTKNKIKKHPFFQWYLQAELIGN